MATATAKGPTRDLTTGPISGHFRRLAIPAALGMLFNTLYNVVDIWFAGLLSTDAQAGLALGFQAFFLFMSVGIGLSAAMGALVGGAMGARDAAGARRLAAQGISFAVIAAGLLAVLGWFVGPWLVALVSEPGAYRDAGTQYFRWLLLALPGFLLAFACNGILQAQGDSLSMQRAMMVAFLANIALNPLCIYGIPGVWDGIGFNGIALSTVLSQTGVMVFLIRQALRSDALESPRRSDFRPRTASYVEIVVQAAPTSVALLVMFMSGFVIQYALKGFGEHAIAGYGVGIRIEQIMLLPILGMTGALLPIAAQNFGAQEFDRVRAALFFCWKVGLVMSAIAGPALWFGGSHVLRFFTADPEVIRVGTAYLRVDSVVLPIYMMLFAINSFLQALRRPVWTLWISLYRQGFAVAFFIWVFVGLWGFDEWGVWYGVACAVVSGWLISLVVADRIARAQIGGLWAPAAVTAA